MKAQNIGNLAGIVLHKFLCRHAKMYASTFNRFRVTVSKIAKLKTFDFEMKVKDNYNLIAFQRSYMFLVDSQKTYKNGVSESNHFGANAKIMKI